MITFRNHLSILLCLCYLWTLSVPVIMGCPCGDHDKSAAENDRSGRSCAHHRDTSDSCCGSMMPEEKEATSDAHPNSECCRTPGQCGQCPWCLSTVQHPATNQQEPVRPGPELVSVIDGFSDILTISPTAPVAKEPPECLNLAPHIPTTVLLC